MVFILDLDDNAQIHYVMCKTKIKHFVFTYKGKANGITTQFEYEVFFDGEHDKFIVKTFLEDDVIFDTYKDCQTYIYKRIKDLKNQLDTEQQFIKAYIDKNNKRKHKKNKE